MKYIKIFIITVGMSLLMAGAAPAENSLKSGAKALSFGITNRDIEISGRFLPADEIAVLAGFGFAVGNNDETTNDFSFSVGMRKYLAKADLAPFVGAGVSYRSADQIVKVGSGTDVETTKTFGIDGHFGVEYFFAKQVSAEAQVGIGLSDIHNVNGTGADETQIGTFSSGVTVNFYLP